MNFVGIYTHQVNSKAYNNLVPNTCIAMITISSIFILWTVIQDYDKAFYLKYKINFDKYNKQKKSTGKDSKTKSGKKGGKKGEHTYERSQSFAVWLKFQQFQDKKVKMGDDDDDSILLTEEDYQKD